MHFSWTTADAFFSLRLQVGRVLRGPLLGGAVVLRNIALSLLMLGDDDSVAPAWVSVTDRRDGSKFKVRAGREFQNGEIILAQMRQDAARMLPDEFTNKWRP